MVVAFLRFPLLHDLPLHYCQNRTNVSDPISDVLSRYPGSKQQRRTVASPAASTGRAEPDRWDAKPVIKSIKGEQLELFTIGQLGQAINGRAAVTMRLWTRNGVIPEARLRLSPKNGKGGRRYYTRAQVEGIAQIAREEGLFVERARITPTFTARVVQLFRDLEKK